MADRDDTNHLLEAMEALVKPVRTKVLQDGPVGTGLAGQHAVTVELPPLLRQLDEAIRGTIGIGGSGALPWQRNMLDADALFRFMKINSAIKDWARMVAAPITPDDAVKTLQSWYLRFVDTRPSPEREKFYTAKMRSWAEQIVTKLNPPRVWDLPDNCPNCDADSWWSAADKCEYPRPLIVEYHETGPNLIQEATARCRLCDERWGVRELAYAIEQAEVARQETPAQ
jgi:hypothetical protein